MPLSCFPPPATHVPLVETDLLFSALPALALVLLLPILPGEPAGPSSDERLPVLLRTGSAAALSEAGTEAARASRQIGAGAVEVLKSRGFAVTREDGGGIRVEARPKDPASAPAAPSAQSAVPDDKVLTLIIGLSSSGLAAASGAETRFGGGGEASWRLASLIQRHFVTGMREVLAYDSFDRGVVEVGSPEAGTRTTGAEMAWVASYPLFATNPRESDLARTPENLKLLSMALANAVDDYLSPSLPTPRRETYAGYRRLMEPRAVDPWTVWEARDATKLALTFDGGASAGPTPAILEALREAGVRATMFMTADFVERNPELVVRMAKDGHEFGNHSATHPDMTLLSDEEIADELERLESAVVVLTGRSTRPWFRPPFGASSERLERVVAEQGYYVIMWTADSADWRNDVDASTVRSRLLRYGVPGAIMIQHLGSPQSAEVTASVLAALAQSGIGVTTLSDLLGVP